MYGSFVAITDAERAAMDPRTIAAVEYAISTATVVSNLIDCLNEKMGMADEKEMPGIAIAIAEVMDYKAEMWQRAAKAILSYKVGS